MTYLCYIVGMALLIVANFTYATGDDIPSAAFFALVSIAFLLAAIWNKKGQS